MADVWVSEWADEDSGHPVFDGNFRTQMYSALPARHKMRGESKYFRVLAGLPVFIFHDDELAPIPVQAGEPFEGAIAGGTIIRIKER